jgi:hypothetical protein
MFDFESFDQAYAPMGRDEKTARPVSSIPIRKSIKEHVVFWSLNAIILPIVAICCLSIGADGMASMLPVLATKIHNLPLPGAEFLEAYSGFSRLNLAMLASIALFIAVAMLWVRIFRELQDIGTLRMLKNENPIRYLLLTSIAFAIIAADAGVIFVGLQSQASSGWSDVPAYVPWAVTGLYMCSLALLGAWHCDFHYSKKLT